MNWYQKTATDFVRPDLNINRFFQIIHQRAICRMILFFLICLIFSGCLTFVVIKKVWIDQKINHYEWVLNASVFALIFFFALFYFYALLLVFIILHKQKKRTTLPLESLLRTFIFIAFFDAQISRMNRREYGNFYKKFGKNFSKAQSPKISTTITNGADILTLVLPIIGFAFLALFFALLGLLIIALLILKIFNLLKIFRVKSNPSLLANIQRLVWELQEDLIKKTHRFNTEKHI